MIPGRRRTGSVLILLVASIAPGAALAGCSAPDRRLPAGSVELDVAAVRQPDTHACGLATVQALTAYHGLQLDEETCQRIADRTSAQEGLTGDELRDVLERAGLEVYLFRGTPDHAPTGLWRALDDGLPPLVSIASAPGRNHYVLLVGYDRRTGDVAILDPAQGRLVIPAERFLACWQDAERFTLLAAPAGPSTLASRSPSEIPP
jgi:ABC-type bacteriocin/lantibiotic exporter with double-glycine peptidase domain